MEKSAKQKKLEKKILALLSGKSREVAEYVFNDEEILSYQNYSNIVSIKRLGYNDHGPVHMNMAAYNALRCFDLLSKAGIKFNLEKERIGTYEDSQIAVLLAALLHDIGMTVAREDHEIMSVVLARPILNRIFDKFYEDSVEKSVTMRSITIEGILGHMATKTIHSLEAGLVLIGDGCDMEKGRARIPKLLAKETKVGDIHKYSAAAIEHVHIKKGEEKPIAITIEMNDSVGFFQVEEVLYPKIFSSPVKNYIELRAGIIGNTVKQYL